MTIAQVIAHVEPGNNAQQPWNKTKQHKTKNVFLGGSFSATFFSLSFFLFYLELKKKKLIKTRVASIYKQIHSTRYVISLQHLLLRVSFLFRVLFFFFIMSKLTLIILLIRWQQTKKM